MKYTLDAEGKAIGRVASEAATLLMGKKETGFTRHKLPECVEVVITNAIKSKMSEKKRANETYKSFSGYPGGLKIMTMDDVIKSKGMAEVYRIAVYGMLPKNKLRSKMIKRLKVTD